MAKTSDSLVRNDLVPIIEKDFPEVGQLQDALSLFLNADRDAYQAYLAEVSSRNAADKGALTSLIKDVQDNMSQVRARMDNGVELAKLQGKEVSAFNDNYAIWRKEMEASTAASSVVFDKSQLRTTELNAVEDGFADVREILNQIQEKLEVSTNVNGRMALEEALLADRDLYQARLDQLLLTRTFDDKQLQVMVADYRENVRQVGDHMGSLRELAKDQVGELAEQFIAGFSKWSERGDHVISLTLDMAEQMRLHTESAAKVERVFAKTRASIDGLSGVIEGRLPAIHKEMADKVTRAQQKNETTQAGMHRSILMFLALAIIVGFAVAIPVVFTARLIMRMLRRTMTDLSSASEQVRAASFELANASNQLAQGASEQAASMEETMSSLDELSSMTKQNTESSSQASDGVRQSTEASERARNSMQKMLQTMTQIKESSDQTAQIVKSIDDVAFQTNILALNAAVEAARAGDSGRGFAVVAEEVRMLAQRSAEAAKASGVKVQDARQRTEEGVRVTAELNEILDLINESIGGVSSMVGQVAVSSNEQTIGIDRIAEAARQVETLGQSTAANAEETASASEELASQSEALGLIVRDLGSFVNGKAGEPARNDSHQSAEHERFNEPMQKSGPERKFLTSSHR